MPRALWRCRSSGRRQTTHHWSALFLAQAFNWESHRQKLYKQLMGRVKDISDAGFTGVWMPPPSDSVSPQVRRGPGRQRVEGT